MSKMHAGVALLRSSQEFRHAMARYAEGVESAEPDELQRLRSRLDRAMDTYEQAVRAHRTVFAQDDTFDDPRHVRPPHGRTKGL